MTSRGIRQRRAVGPVTGETGDPGERVVGACEGGDGGANGDPERFGSGGDVGTGTIACGDAIAVASASESGSDGNACGGGPDANAGAVWRPLG